MASERTRAELRRMIYAAEDDDPHQSAEDVRNSADVNARNNEAKKHGTTCPRGPPMWIARRTAATYAAFRARTSTKRRARCPSRAWMSPHFQRNAQKEKKAAKSSFGHDIRDATTAGARRPALIGNKRNRSPETSAALSRDMCL